MNLTSDIVNSKLKSGAENLPTILKCNLLEIIRIIEQKAKNIILNKNLNNLLLAYLSNLKVATIESNCFKSISNELFFIDLSHNELEAIKINSFANIQKVSIINLSSNQISFVESAAFKGIIK
jgi:hypothetical protein